MMIIYEAFFIKSPDELERLFPQVHSNKFYHHATIAFRPKVLSHPHRLNEEVLLKIVGRLTTDLIDALVVEMPFALPEIAFPHITLSTAEGVAPKEVKKAFQNAGNSIELFNAPSLIEARYGFYDGKNTVFQAESVFAEQHMKL